MSLFLVCLMYCVRYILLLFYQCQREQHRELKHRAHQIHQSVSCVSFLHTIHYVYFFISQIDLSYVLSGMYVSVSQLFFCECELVYEYISVSTYVYYLFYIWVYFLWIHLFYVYLFLSLMLNILDGVFITYNTLS